jgi:hypothetical protein
VLLLYSESLGVIAVAEVLALAPDASECGASKRARTAEGSDLLDFFGSSLNKEITGLTFPQQALPQFFFFFFRVRQHGSPGCTAASGLLCYPIIRSLAQFQQPCATSKESILTEALLVSSGSTTESPKT